MKLPYKKPLSNRLQNMVLLKKYTYRIPSAAWKRVNILDTWRTQEKSSSHKFRSTWSAMLCLQLSSPSLEGRCSRGTPVLEDFCLQYCMWTSERWNSPRVSQAKHAKASNLQWYCSLMPSLVKSHTQLWQNCVLPNARLSYYLTDLHWGMLPEIHTRNAIKACT